MKTQEDEPSPRTPEMILIRSAQRWLEAALDAWIAEDYERVAALAPLSVEHLGKAILWRMNPVLLVPLAAGAEPTLLSLALKPNLDDSKLRTISLDVLLSRLGKVLENFPIEGERKKRLVDTRNGAMHVGSSGQSKHILDDCLTLCWYFLENLQLNPKAFYGLHYDIAVGLRDQKRTRIESFILSKRTAANHILRKRSAEMSRPTAKTVNGVLEKDRQDALRNHGFELYLEGADCTCPVCSHTGLLLGRVDVDSEVEWDSEITSDGESIPYVVSSEWILTHHPEAFACNVCQLVLRGNEQLAAFKLRTVDEVIDQKLLGAGFDASLHEFKEYLRKSPDGD